MDWGRAKTILIFIFLFLNIFLVYNLAVQQNDVKVISPEEVLSIKTVLQSHNIKINTELPTRIKPHSFLRIEGIGYNEADLVKNFIGASSNVVKTKIGDNGIRYSLGNKNIEIYSDNRLVYTNGTPNDNLEGLNKGKIVKYVEDFLISKKININNRALESYKPQSYGYELAFKQTFKNYEIFQSAINTKLTQKGIVYLEIRWVSPVDFVEQPKEIKSPVDILLIFAKDLGSTGKVEINDFSLGYYFPQEDITNASVYAIPVWRIGLSDGRTFYYNAYEGYLEDKK